MPMETFNRADYPCKQSVPLVRVAEPALLHVHGPGAFAWVDEGHGLYFHVNIPYWDWIAGTFGHVHSIPIGHDPGGPKWQWKEGHPQDRDRPWLAPSLLCWTWPPETQGRWEEYRIEAWHGFVEGDILKSC